MFHSGEKIIENYKDYRNRTVQKHVDRINKQLWQIKQCTLKQEDKEKAKKQLMAAIQNFEI